MKKKRGGMVLDENEFFRQATLQISSSLNIEIAMKRCMDYLKKYIPISGIFFGSYEPNLNIGKIHAAIWPPDLQKPDETISIPMEFWHRMKKEWAKKPGIRILNDIESEEPLLREKMGRIWPLETSHIRMDLELDNRRLGKLGLFAKGKNRYTDLHAHLLSLLHKPFAIAFSNMLEHKEVLRLKDMLVDDNRYLHQEMLKMTGDRVVGANFGLKGVMKMVSQVAPLDSPVLLTGETGVGKELIANAIHSSSQRKNGPYIKVNCGAIPESLIDSELFGHEKGAFTGAISRKRGRFERAHNGTIFLDEIGELPSAAQVRLLRVLQEHEIERVGGTESISVDVRLISATHQNLEAMVRLGQFREDLWFRINVFPIVIPPLRQRTEDIPALVTHFIEQKSAEMKKRNLPSLAQGALDKLLAYHWPGNVREMENLVERELILNQVKDGGDLLRFEIPSIAAVPTEKQVTEKQDDVVHPLDEMIAAYIHKALERSDGRVEGENGAARMLGLHPSTLRGRMRKLGIPYGRRS